MRHGAGAAIEDGAEELSHDTRIGMSAASQAIPGRGGCRIARRDARGPSRPQP